MNCTGNCTQGRNCSCLPVEMFDNKPSMLASRWFWALGAVSFALLWSAVAFIK